MVQRKGAPTMMTRPKDAVRQIQLTAKMEPFDSFWEGPTNIEKGYGTFYQFYSRDLVHREVCEDQVTSGKARHSLSCRYAADRLVSAPLCELTAELCQAWLVVDDQDD